MVKKSIIVLVATMLILFGGKFGYDYYQDNYSKMSKVAVEEITTIERMKEVLSEKETVFVYVGRPNCGDSDIFEKYFIDMMDKEGIDNLYYFNIIEIVKENEEGNKYKEILKEEFGVQYTPTLAKFQNGTLVLKSEWTPKDGYDKDMAEKFIEKSGIKND